jgi:hypothetical protein
MSQPNLTPPVNRHGDEYPRSRPGVIGYTLFIVAIIGGFLIYHWPKISAFFS